MTARRKGCLWSVALIELFFVLLCVFLHYEAAWRFAKIRARAAAIVPGDSQERVRELLGKPDYIGGFLAKTGAETYWIYWKRVDSAKVLAGDDPFRSSPFGHGRGKR